MGRREFFPALCPTSSVRNLSPGSPVSIYGRQQALSDEGVLGHRPGMVGDCGVKNGFPTLHLPFAEKQTPLPGPESGGMPSVPMCCVILPKSNLLP